MSQNVFWVVRNSPRWGNSCSMFNRVPQKIKIYPSNAEAWYSLHGVSYVREDTAERFDDVTFDSEPAKVRLVRSEREMPDFFVERCGENLYINSRLEKYWKPMKVRRTGLLGLIWKWKSVVVASERVPHVFRVSNKLFPEIKEDDGIVKMDIERI